jgi:hypothetical protein
MQQRAAGHATNEADEPWDFNLIPGSFSFGAPPTGGLTPSELEGLALITIEEEGTGSGTGTGAGGSASGASGGGGGGGGGEDRSCSVCLDEIAAGERVIDLPCKHLFHRDCLRSWLEHKNDCPKCRAPALADRQGTRQGMAGTGMMHGASGVPGVSGAGTVRSPPLGAGVDPGGPQATAAALQGLQGQGGGAGAQQLAPFSMAFPVDDAR